MAEKNDLVSLNWSKKINNILFLSCTLKGMKAYFSLSLPPRISALCAFKRGQVSHGVNINILRGYIVIIMQKKKSVIL